jgi:creatinine amidohydrolase
MDKYYEIFEKPDDHAGQFETSVALALFPELVELQHAQKALARPFRFEALNKGWIQTSRKFARLNDFCAAGDPAGASAEKGKKYLDLVCQRISEFLIELAEAEIDKMFPHEIER